jgi:hypothetical protein
MSMAVSALSAALAVALLVLGLVLLRARRQGDPEIVYVDRPYEVSTVQEVVKYRDRPVEVIKREVEYVERPEPDTLVPGSEHLADPEALPDVPDGVPDSVADGARLGNLIVRAASTRGETGRERARVRRQAVSLAILEAFDPPVLLSAVAAGRPTGRRSQIGALQACRSIQHKLSDAAVSIEAAWYPAPGVGGGASDDRLGEVLRGVLRAMADPLTEAAKWRGIEPHEIATELTCVLTRLGDGPRRAHLAFGVGAGPVLVMRPGSAPAVVLKPMGRGETPTAVLPADPDTLSWARFETAPGEVALACTSSTAGLLSRSEFGDHVAAEWLTAPPSLTRFLAQLNFADKLHREDRTAVALWERKEQ